MNLKPLALIFVLGFGLDCSADTLTGTVRDAKGRPVAGARVDVATAAPKAGPAMFCPSCYLDCAKWTKTDTGRVRTPHARHSTICSNNVAGPEGNHFVVAFFCDLCKPLRSKRCLSFFSHAL